MNMRDIRLSCRAVRQFGPYFVLVPNRNPFHGRERPTRWTVAERVYTYYASGLAL
jgi:hypothetical protein